MKDIKYRELSINDLDEILDMEKDFHNPWSREAFLIEFDGEFNNSIGLEIDGLFVGYVFYSSYLDEVNINHFVIKKSERKKGYASLIMDELLRIMDPKQLLYLEVSVKNKKAINLYKKYGLEIIQIREDYYGKGQDAYIMQRDRKEDL